MALNIYKLTPGDSETPTFSSVERTCPDTPNRKYVEIVPTGNIPTKLKKTGSWVGWGCNNKKVSGYMSGWGCRDISGCNILSVCSICPH
jgi:hypothetical protein